MKEKVYAKGYKGFEKGLVCKGKQYKEHTVFEELAAIPCKTGMHYCENPFDVLDYYDLVNEKGEFNDFAEVEALEEPKTDDGKKFCTTKLKVGAKLSFSGFVKACVSFVIEKTKCASDKIGSSGDYANIGSSGNYAQIGSSGNSARIGSAGDDARIGSAGHDARIGSAGDYSRIGSAGDYARIGSAGDDARIGSAGHDARIGSAGDYSRIGSAGDYARIGSAGDDARIGSAGDDARIGSAGDYARIGSAGHDARIGSTGIDSVICCAGNHSQVKAKKGSWITLSEWGYSEEKGRYIPLCVKTEYVDGERIKEDTWYKLENGVFVEVNVNEWCIFDRQTLC